MDGTVSIKEVRRIIEGRINKLNGKCQELKRHERLPAHEREMIARYATAVGELQGLLMTLTKRRADESVAK